MRLLGGQGLPVRALARDEQKAVTEGEGQIYGNFPGYLLHPAT